MIKHCKQENVVLQDDEFVAINDIRPAADQHYLIITKQHIRDPKHLKGSDLDLCMLNLLKVAFYWIRNESYNLLRFWGNICTCIKIHSKCWLTAEKNNIWFVFLNTLFYLYTYMCIFRNSSFFSVERLVATGEKVLKDAGGNIEEAM